MLPRRFSSQFSRRTSNHQRSRVVVGRCTTFILLASLLICSIPGPTVHAAIRDTIKFSNGLAGQAEEVLASWSGFIWSLTRPRGRGMPQDQGSGRGIKPPSPPSKEEKEAAVASLRMNPANEVVLQSRQPMLFVAIPLDSQEVTIHGLLAEWESNKPEVISVQENGEAVAGVPGTAILTARAGNVKEHVRVTVVEGTSEEFGGKKKEDSRRDGRRVGRVVSGSNDVKIARKSDSRKKRAHALSPLPAMFLRDINDDPLPDGETGSLFSPGNGVGTPPGRTTPGAVTPPTAADGTEMPGSENFTFGVPLVGLPGRGLDLSLSLAYNSRAYNKSTAFNGATWMTYDVDGRVERRHPVDPRLRPDPRHARATPVQRPLVRGRARPADAVRLRVLPVGVAERARAGAVRLSVEPARVHERGHAALGDAGRAAHAGAAADRRAGGVLGVLPVQRRPRLRAKDHPVGSERGARSRCLCRA